MWSGDVSAIARHWGCLSTEKLLGRYARRSDGLLLTGGEKRRGCIIPGGGDIVDWPPEERDGFEFRPVNGVVNAFYYRNLIEMSQMTHALGRSAESETLAVRAAQVKKAYRNVFRDARTGLFVDGEGSRHSSLHVNTVALAFGLAEPDEMSRLVQFLDDRKLSCSVYFAQYLLEAFCKAGRVDKAIEIMASDGDRSWKGMMDFGSTITMEAWNMRVKPNQDLNHAWGTAPLNIISRYILGVTPLEPGFTRIAIAPQMGGLWCVEGRVPTSRGPVDVCVRQGRLTVETPARSRIVWNGHSGEFGPGRYVFE